MFKATDHLLDAQKCRDIIGVLIMRFGLKDQIINIAQEEIEALKGMDLCERLSFDTFQIKLESTPPQNLPN